MCFSFLFFLVAAACCFSQSENPEQLSFSAWHYTAFSIKSPTSTFQWWKFFLFPHLFLFRLLFLFFSYCCCCCVAKLWHATEKGLRQVSMHSEARHIVKWQGYALWISN